MNFGMVIGPMAWRIRSVGDTPAVHTDRAYRAFISTEKSDQMAPMDLTVDIKAGTVNRPGGPPVYMSGQNWALWKSADEYRFCTGYTQQAPDRCCTVDAACRTAEIVVRGDRLQSCEQAMCYPIDQILTWGCLSHCSGMLIHAAAVVYDGEAYVFTGRSGAGKSTMAELFAQSGGRVLNDDRVLLYKKSGQWYAAGTPWHGSGRYALNETAPLAGLFLLRQSDENRIREVGPNECVQELLVTVSVPWFEEEWTEATLSALHRLSREVPLSLLDFTKSLSAVHTVADYMLKPAGVAV